MHSVVFCPVKKCERADWSIQEQSPRSRKQTLLTLLIRKGRKLRLRFHPILRRFRSPMEFAASLTLFRRAIPLALACLRVLSPSERVDGMILFDNCGVSRFFFERKKKEKSEAREELRGQMQEQGKKCFQNLGHVQVLQSHGT